MSKKTKTGNKKELTTIAKGAGLSIFGNFFNTGANFIVALALIRLLGVANFGLYSLGVEILGISAMFATIGLTSGSLKYVAVYKGINDQRRLKGVILQSTFLTLFFGVLLAIIVFLFSDKIALLFKKPDLGPALQIFAIGIPFFALMSVFGPITRGFKTTKYVVLTTKIAQPLVYLFLICLVYISGSKLLGVTWAYILTIATLAVMLFFSLKKLFPGLLSKKLVALFEIKKLLTLSLPLMSVEVILFLVHRTDIFIIGYFLPAESVGIYRVALRGAAFVAMFLTALNSIFTPIISDLYHRQKRKALEALFKTVTRWGFYFGFLIFLIIVISPNELLRVFGADFLVGKNSLIILALGQLINVSVGCAALMLMMTGYEKMESLNSVGVLILNIILNLTLIPRWGILGAAIATAVSYNIANIIRLIEIYFSLQIHPFNVKFLRGIVAGLIAITITFFWKNALFVNWHYLINLGLSSLFILIIFVIFLFLFKFEKEDKFIFKKIRQKL